MQPAPRKLTTLQRATLIRVLREFPDQQVDLRYSSSAEDALVYAQDFRAVFKAIGWKVSDAAPWDSVSARTSGLALVTSDGGALAPCAEAFRDTLRIYGIEVATLFDPACTIDSGGFVLAVGPRPQ